jgi:hypothetical protein
VFFAIITILNPEPEGRTGADVLAGALVCSPPQPPSQPAKSVTMSAVVNLLFMFASPELRLRSYIAVRVRFAGIFV